MRNKLYILFGIILGFVLILLVFGLDNKNQRTGIDAELAKESRAILAVVDYYYNDLGLSYEDMEEFNVEAATLISNYSKEKFIPNDETASEDEHEIIMNTTDVISCYMFLHEKKECLNEIKEHRNVVENLFNNN